MVMMATSHHFIYPTDPGASKHIPTGRRTKEGTHQRSNTT